MRYILLFVPLLAFANACSKQKAAEKLPPAEGQGAKALPELPTLNKDDGIAATGDLGKTTGTTFPIEESALGPNQSGVITRIFVKEGDKVKKGTPLFQQDLRNASLGVAQAKAQLEAAQVNLTGAQSDYDRNKTLFDQNAINKMQWEQTQTRYESAKVMVKQGQVALQMAQKMLSDGTIYSPINGVVTAKLKNAGEMATMMPPTVVLIVQNQSLLELRFRLPEQALAIVKKGDIVTAHFSAINVSRDARIVRIAPSVDLQTRTVEYIANIDNGDMALRSGLLAEVQLGKDLQAGTGEPQQ
jgi:RND family efflux transporter MFP subunit